MAKKRASNTLTKEALGKRYYDIIEIYTNKILYNILEESRDLGIDKENLNKIKTILENQKLDAKSWGYDQIAKLVE